MKRGITFGTFDIFHYGHLRILMRARERCDHLTVGVSSDALSLAKKGRMPVYTLRERLAIIGALRVVDEVFVEESLEAKGDYIQRYGADVLFMGEDWAGKFDQFRDVCEVCYLPRTRGISTTALIERIRV